MDHFSWRSRISQDFDRLKLDAICRMAAMIKSITVEEALRKFDVGKQEHNDDLSLLVKADEQRSEVIDFVNYEAL